MKLSRLLAVWLAFAIGSATAAPSEAPAVVLAVEVQLFLAHTGRLSEPLNDGAVLWNTIIGAGDTSEPSTSTLVRVLVERRQAPPLGRTVVRLTVREADPRKSPIVLGKDLGVFDPGGKQYVAFWLPNTGCSPLHLSAKVQGSSVAVAREVLFKCGE